MTLLKLWCWLAHRRFWLVEKTNNGWQVMQCIRCNMEWVEER